MAVYVDHNATTPLDSRVLDAMLPFLQEHYGNPSSRHHWGRLTRDALDRAREQVANLVNVHPDQVIFTSGGTEANNHALKGLAATQRSAQLLHSAIEHESVRATCRSLARHGWQVGEIAVDAGGLVSAHKLQQMLRDDTRLVSVMLANNESGVIQDVAAISDMVREAGAVMHTDAVQAAGKIPVDFHQLGVHMMTLSGHKLYGPKGTGALVIDKAVDIEPLIEGGGHEKGRRSGTENVAGIVGFGMAAELARTELESRQQHLHTLQQQFEQGLGQMKGTVIFADKVERVPNTVFFSVAGIDGETLMMNLDRQGYALSSGSACSSSKTGPSHVLLAMGVDEQLAQCAIRVSFGQQNTGQDVGALLKALYKEVNNLHSLASVAAAH